MMQFFKKAFSFVQTFIKTHDQKIIIFSIFLVGFIVYFWNQRFLADIVYRKNDIVFGADTRDTFRALREVNFDNDMKKHIFFSFTLSPVVGFFQSVLAVSFQRSIRLAFALVAGLNVAGVFYLLRKNNNHVTISFLITLLFTFCFSNLVIFSIPETYQMSNLLILFYLAALFSLRDRLDWRNSLFLSVLAGLASLYNFPLLSLMGIHLILMFPKNKFLSWIALIISNVLVGSLIFLSVNYFIYGPGFLAYFQSYSSRWASLTNFLHVNNYATVFANFFLFAVVSPGGYLPAVLGPQDVAGYFSSFFRTLLICMWVGGLIYAIVITARAKVDKWLYVGLYAWILVMTLFYVYFNPKEALLYSSQTLFPLLFLFTQGFDLRSKFAKFQLLWLIIFCILLIINNGLAFYPGVLLN
jgi:hypothetical protein